MFSKNTQFISIFIFMIFLLALILTYPRQSLKHSLDEFDSDKVDVPIDSNPKMSKYLYFIKSKLKKDPHELLVDNEKTIRIESNLKRILEKND